MKFNGSAKVWEAASKDSSRPVLCAVNLCIEGTGKYRKGWLEATDSYALVRVPVDELDAKDIAGMLSPDALKDAVKASSTRLGYCELDCSDSKIAKSADGLRSWLRPEGQFPESKNLIVRNEAGEPMPAGEHEGGTLAFGVNAALLARVAKAMGGRIGGLRIEVGSPLRPIMVRPLDSPVLGCECIVMPVRLAS